MYHKPIGNARYAALCTAIATGLKESELLALRWSDVNFDSATLSVRRSVCQGKHACIYRRVRSQRRVLLAPEVASVLRKYQQKREAQCSASGSTLAAAAGILSDSVLNRRFHVAPPRAVRKP